MQRILGPFLPIGLFGCSVLVARRTLHTQRASLVKRSANALHHTILTPPLSANEKVLVVGDVHGCLDELKLLVAKAERSLNPTTDTLRVILVGDLVNKGPFSAEVIQYVREFGWHCVMGNHDVAAITAFQHGSDGRELNVRYAWADALTTDDKQWLCDLPYSISIPQLNALVVHAGVVPGVPLEQQHLPTMTLMRNVSSCGTGVGTRTSQWQALDGAKDDSEESIPWVEAWGALPNPKPHVYFGHDAKRKLQLTEHCTGLDTGACYGFELSGMLLLRPQTAATEGTGEERRLLQVAALEVYAQPGGGAKEGKAIV